MVLQRKQRASQPLRAGQKEEKVVKTSFFRRLHLTGGWAQAQYPSTHTYGIVGMQVGVVETGRFTIPAIGVMLMMIPDGRGGHEWKPATTLGFGFRLFDFVPPVDQEAGQPPFQRRENERSWRWGYTELFRDRH